jgi:hypothetical protein
MTNPFSGAADRKDRKAVLASLSAIILSILVLNVKPKSGIIS